ncbi:MAG: SCO family protein [Bdellovibrionales bacterium]|nr:SCO family protein [Bdellovibrionales bacterium]
MIPGFTVKALAISFVAAAFCSLGLIWYLTYEPPVGGDFSLTYRGNEWRLSQNAKELNILYFGYTKCPDVCPLTLSHAGQAFHGLTEDEAKRVHLLFLSVDRDNDVPEDVANYAAHFFPSFLGLSGTREQIDKTIAMYHASYIIEKDEKSHLGYSIAHTDRLFFLNNNGVVQATISNPRSSEEIIKTIKEHL